LSRFEELRRREAARAAILYAFNLIEPDGEDLRNLPFLNRKAALAWLPRETKAGVLVNEHVVKDGLTVFAMRAGSGQRHRLNRPVPRWIEVRNPASIAVQPERSEIWNRRASGSARRR
jgi:ribosomal protein L39E